jgi:PAS domain-containing protein
MAIPGPEPAAEPVAPALRQLLTAAGADWTTVRTTAPPKPNLCPSADGWLGQKFRQSVLELGRRLGVDARAFAELASAVESANLRSGRTLPTIAVLGVKGASGKAAPIERTQACDLLTAWLAPLLDPTAYEAWLDELAGSQWFWRGGQAGSPAVPLAVQQRESDRDRELADRWAGAPPQPPQLAAKTPEADRAKAERRYREAMAAYQRRLARADAFLRSEPTAPGLTVPQGAGVQEQKLLAANRAAAQKVGFPLLVLGGKPLPANLFVAEVAGPVSDYLGMLRAVLEPGTASTGLFMPLMGLAYGMLALALVPLNCLYDTVHGTCVIETLLPALSRSADALRGYGGQRLRRALVDRPARRLALPTDALDDPAFARALDAFSAWSARLAEELRQSHARLLRVVGDQSGGRVRTPAPGQLAPGGHWTFTLNEPRKDGSTEQVDHSAEELIGYETAVGGGSKRDAPADAEVFWMLRSVWDRVGTAVALVNQAGMRFWFNAANNRWGGAHPPHRVHRQGCSFDFDIGYGWREGHKVPNVKKRDASGRALSEDVVPKNKENVDCLHRVDRLAGWIGTQAWLLVGVSQYLYGDAALVTEAYRHLESRVAEAKQSIVKPARLDPVIDADGHFDHWHFEVLAGQAPGQIDPYGFQVDDPELLDRLRAWAVARDEDPVFWRKFAGLKAAPTKLDDFKDLPDADDWKRWWSRGHAPADEETYPPSDAGIPLLPIWAPAEAPETFEVDGCFDPREDNPSIFEPGQIEV